MAEDALDAGAGSVQIVLRFGRHLFHLAQRLREEDAHAFTVELFRELLRHVSGIGDEHAGEPLVETHELRAVAHVARRERERQRVQVRIDREVEFEAVQPAFSGLSPACIIAHRLVVFPVLVEAYGYVGGVGVLHEVRQRAVLVRQADAQEHDQERE